MSLSPAQGTFLASASRTTTQTQDEQSNRAGYKGIRVVLDMTVVTASPSVTLTIQCKDRTSGEWHTLLSGAAVTGDTTNVYTLHPGAPVTTNVSANAQLGSAWRIVVTAGNANAGTYSVGYELLP